MNPVFPLLSHTNSLVSSPEEAAHKTKEMTAESAPLANSSPLTIAILEQLQIAPFSRTYFLPTDHVPLVQEFHSERECKNTAVQCLRKAYDLAQAHITPGSEHCAAQETADYYVRVINHCFTPIIDSLEGYCQKANKDTVYKQLRSLMWILWLQKAGFKENPKWETISEFSV